MRDQCRCSVGWFAPRPETVGGPLCADDMGGQRIRGAVVGDGDVDVDDESLRVDGRVGDRLRDDGGEFGVELGDGPRLG